MILWTRAYFRRNFRDFGRFLFNCDYDDIQFMQSVRELRKMKNSERAQNDTTELRK